MTNDYSEDSLVEQPAVSLFSELGWETANCFYEKFGEKGTLGRETTSEVVLVPRLRAALLRLNPVVPSEAIELKASHKRLEHAYRDNLRDYKNAIPQIFWYNGFIILSNGSQSKIGSMTAQWEHFAEWKKINSEGEEGIVSLDTMIRGTCELARQYLGVNNATEALKQIENNRRRLGVFWHKDLQVKLIKCKESEKKELEQEGRKRGQESGT